MLILSHSDVSALLPLAACADLMQDAMKQVSQRHAVLPLRQFMGIPGTKGKLGLMPGYIADPARFGVKIVSKYERPQDDPHGTHVGAVMIFDAQSGLPLALVEGGTLTAIRTSATSAMATRVLARPDATRLAVLGCGEEAHYHVRAFLDVLPLRQIVVWGRSPQKAERFASSLKLPGDVSISTATTVESAVRDADIVCTVTSAATPILHGEHLAPGTHVTLVGSAIPTTAEADSAVVTRSRFYVDYRDAALAQAGELRNAINEGLVTADHIIGEIGEVLLGTKPGRTSAEDITVYKSLGVTAQDLMAADFVYQEAIRKNVGTTVEL